MSAPRSFARTHGFALCFGLLLAIGLAIRIAAADYSLGIAHADEHQQYLEQAPRLAWQGPAMQFWEQKRGMRNLLYPYCLAGSLIFVEAIGIDNPITQAALLRGCLAIAIFLLIAWQAWLERQRGASVCSLALLALAALMGSAVYVNVRLLTENVIILPMLLGLLALERRPFLAGICFGIMFAVRFQSAFLVAGVVLLMIWDDVRSGSWVIPRESRTVRLSTGLLLSIFLAVGLLDRVTLGTWFHSPLECFQANIFENAAAQFGVEPWHYYLKSNGASVIRMSLLAPLVLWLGAVKERRIAFLMALMIVGHSVISHKEARFLWCLLPLLLLLLARGIETLWNGIRHGPTRIAAISLLAISFLVGSARQAPKINWRSEPYYSSALALADLHRRDDVRGVGMGIDSGPCFCGNYFYLRQDVPLLYKHPHEFAQMARTGDSVNYFILHRPWLTHFDPDSVEIVAEYPDLVTCRLKKPMQTTPGKDARTPVPLS